MAASRAIATMILVAGMVLLPALDSDTHDVEPLPVDDLVTAVAGTAIDAPDPGPIDLELAPLTPTADTASALEALVYRHAVEAPLSSAGVAVSVTVSHGDDLVSVAGAAPYDPASSAKAYWVAAAVDAVGVEAVAPYSEAIFSLSDNGSAGEVIDLVGVDAINDFTRAAGMDDTYLSLWIDGGRFRSGAEALERNYLNTSTTADAVAFLDQLAAGELLGAEETAQVMAWMARAPDNLDNPTVWGGVLADQLPPDVAAFTMHKAGWLTPGCCTAVDNELVAIGIVPLPDGSRFTIAATTTNGADYDAQAAWIGGLTAEIYDLLAAPS